MYGSGIKLAVAALGVGFAVISASGTAMACWPQRSTASGVGHAGWQRQGLAGNLIASKANIREYNAFLSNGTGSIVAAWTMLTDTPPLAEWAQVGWLEVDKTSFQPYGSRCGNPPANGWSRCSISEYKDLSFQSDQIYAAQPVDQSTKYEVHKEIFTGIWAFTCWINGVRVGSNGDGWSYSLDGVQQYGEVHNQADQMPGDKTTPMWIDFAQYANGGGGWVDLAGAAYNVWQSNPTGYWSASPTSSHEINVWDNACTHPGGGT